MSKPLKPDVKAILLRNLKRRRKEGISEARNERYRKAFINANPK